VLRLFVSVLLVGSVIACLVLLLAVIPAWVPLPAFSAHTSNVLADMLAALWIISMTAGPVAAMCVAIAGFISRRRAEDLTTRKLAGLTILTAACFGLLLMINVFSLRHTPSLM
jgi:hypothetical protein